VNRKLALQWVLLIVAVMVSAMAIRSAIRFAQTPKYHDIPYTTGTLKEGDRLPTPVGQPSPDDPPTPVGLPFNADALDQLLTSADRQPTDAEPADLPPHPRGTNLMRFIRTDHRRVEHLSIWSISDVNLEDAASFYQQAAMDKQFTPSRQLTDTPDVIETRYHRDGRALTVRCRQAGSEVRVVLQLRYTVAD